MGVDARIVGPQTSSSGVREAHVAKYNNFSGEHSGLEVLTTRFQEFVPTVIPFLNATLGNAMNQDVSFGGVPELIFDGAGAGWTDTTTSGGEWNLASGGEVVLAHGEDGEFATFEDAVAAVDSDEYTALSGKVDLDNYTPGTQDLLVSFSLAGSPVGVAVGLNGFIDTGAAGGQSFAIPLTNFVLAGSNIDGLTITVERDSGHQPHVKFDDFQLEKTGTPVEFRVVASPSRSDLHVKKVKFLFADTLPGTVSDGTMPGIAYNKILGLTALTNGITVRLVLDDDVKVSATIRQLSDMIGIGANITESISDGVVTFVALELEFSESFVLRRGKDTVDYISVIINDDLSDLDLFTGVVRGAYELDTERN